MMLKKGKALGTRLAGNVLEVADPQRVILSSHTWLAFFLAGRFSETLLGNETSCMFILIATPVPRDAKLF